MKRPRRCIVLLSGGIDSATLAYWLTRQGFVIETVYFDYGQEKVNCERASAVTISRKLGTTLHVIQTPLPSDSIERALAIRESSAQVTNATTFGNVVCMCIMAAALALAHGFKSIALGVNADNTKAHAGLKTNVFRNMEKLSGMWTGNRFRILTPFLEKDKSSIIRIGTELDVPYSDTWSCSMSTKKHCGRCPECLARKRGFREMRLHDPTEYEL